jgi:CO/xanthine dehydrogenase FAD-binding subunit
MVAALALPAAREGEVMKPVPFEYFRPETVAEAAGLLADFREDAAVLAGGMTLGPMLNLRIMRPSAVIDITRIRDLGSITMQRDTVVTGATSIQADALASDVLARDVPLLTLALPWVGHFQTRSRGTLGGSIAHADPSAEIPLCLVVTDGTVVLRSKRRERRLRARDFFIGALTTARQPDELVVALEWPSAPTDAGHGFEEIAQRHGDFAIAAAACQIRLDGAGRIAALALGLGGVENRPVAIETSAFLGRVADKAVLIELAEHAVRSVAPMEDHVADAPYRLALSRVLVGRVVPQAIADAQARRGPLQ